MQIFIRNLKGKTLLFEVESSDTVFSLKNKIYDKDGIPVEFQVLVYEGKFLQNERQLSDYGIEKDANLYLTARLRGAGGISLSVRNIFGTMYTLDVEPHTRVRELLEMVDQRERVCQRMMYRRKIFEEKDMDLTLEECGIQDRSVIVLIDCVCEPGACRKGEVKDKVTVKESKGMHCSIV